MSRALTIINLLLGIAVIAVLAALVADRLSQRIGTALLPKNRPETAVTAPAGLKIENLTFYAPILGNGLFGKASQGQLTPIIRSTSASAAPATAPGELLLLGTATGSFRESFALVRHAARQEERVFRLGEMVFDSGRLVEVRKEQAFIVVNGTRVELLTPMAPPASASPGPSPSGSHHAGGVTSVGPGSFVIDQRALNAALDNPAQAMTDARLLPSQKDGRIEGFRASEVKPNGVFAMIGIRNGDVLVRLNDFPVDSPDKALQSFIALKGQSRLKLDVVRDGQPQTLYFDIR